jgi:hypothetical protein
MTSRHFKENESASHFLHFTTIHKVYVTRYKYGFASAENKDS